MANGSRDKLPKPETPQIMHSLQDTRAFGAAMDYVSRCLVSKIRVSDADTVAIVSETGLNGSDLIQVLTSGASQMYDNPATAEVDLDVAGIGGLVSGVTKVDGDYLYWAFLDPSKADPFVGFGATKRPVEIAPTILSGTGAKGTTTRFGSIATGNGKTFAIGSRVIVHQTTTEDWTKGFNQGVVVATSADWVEVDLDNEPGYGVAIVAATMLITQTDRYAPLLKADGELFGGYRYAYLGHAQRDDAGITYTRQRGEFYYRRTDILFNTQAPVTTTTYAIDTGMFTGSDTREIQIHARARRSLDKVAWNFYIGASTLANQFLVLSNSAADITNEWMSTTLRIPIRADGTGISATWVSAKDGVFDVYLQGWRETRF